MAKIPSQGNNFLFIVGVIIIIVVLYYFSWIALIVTIILNFIVYLFVGKKIMENMEKNILKFYNKEENK